MASRASLLTGIEPPSRVKSGGLPRLSSRLDGGDVIRMSVRDTRGPAVDHFTSRAYLDPSAAH